MPRGAKKALHFHDADMVPIIQPSRAKCWLAKYTRKSNDVIISQHILNPVFGKGDHMCIEL